MCEKSATGPRHPAYSIGFATMCGYGVCLSRRMATTCASHSHILFSTFMRFTVFKCFKLLRRIQATLTPSSQPQTHTDCHALPAHIPTGSTTGSEYWRPSQSRPASGVHYTNNSPIFTGGQGGDGIWMWRWDLDYA